MPENTNMHRFLTVGPDEPGEWVFYEGLHHDGEDTLPAGMWLTPDADGVNVVFTPGAPMSYHAHRKSLPSQTISVVPEAVPVPEPGPGLTYLCLLGVLAILKRRRGKTMSDEARKKRAIAKAAKKRGGKLTREEIEALYRGEHSKGQAPITSPAVDRKIQKRVITV